MKSQKNREPIKGCIIDMDAVALNGIQNMYDVVGEELAKQKVVVDEGLFARYFIGTYLETGLNRAMHSVEKRSSAELAQTIRDAYLARLAAVNVADNRGLLDLVSGLGARNVRVGLLTRLAAATAREKFAPLTGSENVDILADAQPALVGGYPWDAWRHAAETMQMIDRLCVAVVTCAASSRAALAASLTVIAIPDRITEFQDFTGAYDCFSSLDGDASAAILRALRIDA